MHSFSQNWNDLIFSHVKIPDWPGVGVTDAKLTSDRFEAHVSHLIHVSEE